MAAPTLTINASAELEITDGTSGDPVTWNDVWDWDDGGGSSGGDGDIPIDGGGTAKVNTYMTEIVADAVYLILGDVDFGDGSTSSYFQSTNEMVYFEDGYTFAIKNNATFEMGDLAGSWGVDGSMLSVHFTVSRAVTTLGGTGVFKMYSSRIHQRHSSPSYEIKFLGGTLDLRNSVFSGINFLNSGFVMFHSSITSLSMQKVTFENLSQVQMYKTPVIATYFRIHQVANGFTTGLVNVLMTGPEIDGVFTDIIQFNANTFTAQDSVDNLSTPTIFDASGIVVEQYTCNIHVTDKDGADLPDVDIDVTYAHLVEGSDSKTYKCIADFTASDDEFKPIDGSGDWESKWELFDADGGLGGDWNNSSFDYKADAVEFSTVTTDANGDITEQVIQYKKWVGTSEVLEARIHKFTYSKNGYETKILENMIVDHPLVWETELRGKARITIGSNTYFKDDN